MNNCAMTKPRVVPEVNSMQMFRVSGLPDFKPDMDLAQHVIQALTAEGQSLQRRILVVAHEGVEN